MDEQDRAADIPHWLTAVHVLTIAASLLFIWAPALRTVPFRILMVLSFFFIGGFMLKRSWHDGALRAPLRDLPKLVGHRKRTAAQSLESVAVLVSCYTQVVAL